jgi:hypothetical protein
MLREECGLSARTARRFVAAGYPVAFPAAQPSETEEVAIMLQTAIDKLRGVQA